MPFGESNLNPDAWDKARARKVLIENTEDENIPPYAICIITDMDKVWRGEVVYKVAKPTSSNIGDSSLWIFNCGGTVMAAGGRGAQGMGTKDFPCKAIYDVSDGEVSTGDSLGPVDGEWHLSTDGSGLTVMGDDPSATVDTDDLRTCWVELLGVGGGSSDILAKTPVGGIPAATGSGPYTWGSAVCKKVTEGGEVTSEDVTIKNIVSSAIAGNVVIKAAKVGSIWVVDVASCGS